MYPPSAVCWTESPYSFRCRRAVSATGSRRHRPVSPPRSPCCRGSCRSTSPLALEIGGRRGGCTRRPPSAEREGPFSLPLPPSSFCHWIAPGRPVSPPRSSHESHARGSCRSRPRSRSRRRSRARMYPPSEVCWTENPLHFRCRRAVSATAIAPARPVSRPRYPWCRGSCRSRPRSRSTSRAQGGCTRRRPSAEQNIRFSMRCRRAVPAIR